VLSFDTTHAITGCLLDADAHATASGFRGPPVLLVLHDRPFAPAGHRQLRQIRAVEFELDPHEVAGHTQGIPGLLTDLAAALTDTLTDACAVADPDLAAFTEAIVHTAPDCRLLAWAVAYHDLHAAPAGIREVRRVDAVDIDGRVYQISRLRGEAVALVVVDDQPDPAATPATHPGLAALLTAAYTLARHTRPRSPHMTDNPA
jgi:hypothetical protein